MTNFGNNNYRSYTQGTGSAQAPGEVITNRPPTANDVNYPIGQFWLDPATQSLYYLNSQSNQVTVDNPYGLLQSTWNLISVETILTTLSDDNNDVVHPSGSSDTPPDNIQILGGAGITVIADDTLHTLTITNTGTSSNYAPDTGTNPVSGSTVTFTHTSILATGTLSDALRSNGTGASTIAYQTQYAGSNAGSSAASKWGVSQFDSTQFSVTSGFVKLIGGSTPPTLGITPDAFTGPGTSPVVPNGSGNIKLEGGAMFNTGTQANPIRSNSLAANTIDLQIQRAGSNAATSTANNFGVSQFDSNSFGVTSGFVTLNNAGTTGPITKLTGNSGGAILPTAGNINTLGTGSITIAGAGSTLTTQLTGLTQYNVLVGQGSTTIGLIAPSATTGIPLISQGAASYPVFGTAVVAGGGTGSTSFTAFSVICAGTTSTGALQNVSGVGTSGQVLTSNGAGMLPTWQASGASGAVTSITLDAATTPISPSGGSITLTGGQVATGVVGANVIRTRGNTASSATIEIQRSTSNASANSSLNGVCHFDSSKFGVDTNGFVTFIGSTSNITWTDQGGNFSISSNNGYFCTALLTGTLPATPAQGDVLRIVVDTASVVTIVANTGQFIRIGSAISASAGNATSNARGDSLDLVYRSSSATWYQVGGAQGTWTVT